MGCLEGVFRFLGDVLTDLFTASFLQLGIILMPSCVGAFGSILPPNFQLKRGGGLAALGRFGSAAPGLVPAHGVQSPIP